MPDNYKVNGLEIAEVTEVEKNSFRVKLKFEAWSKDETSHWAPVASLMAGSGMGFYCMPNKGDKVLVGFHQGNRHEPYVVGSLWTDSQTPPATDINSSSDCNADGKNLLRYWKTQSGHMIILDDTDKKEKIQIIDKSGKKKIEMVCADQDEDNLITIENGQGNILIKAPQGKLTLQSKKMEIKVDETLDIKAGKKITFKGDDEMEIKAQKDMKIGANNITQEAQQNLKLKGSSGIEGKGTNIKMEASSEMKIKGATAAVEATTQLSLKSNAVAELSGKPVNIN